MKPKPKFYAQVGKVLEMSRQIYFKAPNQIAKELEEFGKLVEFIGEPESFLLTVSVRYDFEEVVKYIRNLFGEKS